MKNRLVIGCCIGAVCFAVAGVATELSVGLNAGGVFPRGDLDWWGNLDPGSGGGVRLFVKPWPFGEFEFGGDYQRFFGTPRPAEGTVIPLRGGFNLVADEGRYAIRCGGGVGYYVFKATAYGWVTISSNEEQPEYDWIPTWGKVTLSGPGLYYGSAVSLKFGRWSLDITPRWNYIFNEGSYTGKAAGEYEGAELDFDLPYNCTYAEAVLGVSYGVF
jgi:hypothetical protein